MNTIYFIAGNIGSEKTSFVQNLTLHLSYSTGKVPSILSLGSLDNTDILTATQDYWGVDCIQQIESHLKLFPEKQHYIVTGPLCGLHMSTIIQKFPTALVYLIKSKNQKIFNDKELLGSKVATYNVLVNQQMHQLASKLSIEWQYVNFPLINPNGAINFSKSSLGSSTIMAVCCP